MIDLENARAFIPFEIRAAEGTQNERLYVPGVLNVCTNTFHIDSAFEREYERRFEGFPPLHALIEAR